MDLHSLPSPFVLCLQARSLDDENDEGAREEAPETRDVVGIQGASQAQQQQMQQQQAQQQGQPSSVSAPGDGTGYAGEAPPNSGAGVQMTTASGMPLSAGGVPGASPYQSPQVCFGMIAPSGGHSDCFYLATERLTRNPLLVSDASAPAGAR